MARSKASNLKSQFQAICDRIDGEIAVLEIKGLSQPILLPLGILPPALKEKDVLKVALKIDERKREKILKETITLIKEIKK